jgi:hypothetical protein
MAPVANKPASANHSQAPLAVPEGLRSAVN